MCLDDPPLRVQPCEVQVISCIVSTPTSHNLSNCRPVFTLRACVMESSDKMVALKNLLGFDRIDVSQNNPDVTVFNRILAALESMDPLIQFLVALREGLKKTRLFIHILCIRGGGSKTLIHKLWMG